MLGGKLRARDRAYASATHALVWAIADLTAERTMQAELAAEARSAIHLDWLLVGLGCLISLVVAVGAVLSS